MKKINLIFLTLFLFIAFSFFLPKEVKAGLEHNVDGWAWVGNATGTNPTIGWISFNCTNQGEYYSSTSNPVLGNPLHGYAWSDNIGWISLNCETGGPGGSYICGAKDYKVFINSNGALSGYAWSDNLGWLSFNRTGPGATGAPPTEPYQSGVDYIATYSTSTNPNRFIGWGRFLNHDGWDGWIKLSCYGDECNAFDYSVTVFDKSATEHLLRGWAWGSEVVGWLTFGGVCKGQNYGVNIATSTGLFSGHAWSKGTDTNIGGVGWISFADFDGDGDVDAADKNVAGSPCAPNCEARLDFTQTGIYCGARLNVCGWARALSAISTNSGGWDGWIKLRGTYGGAGTYGVKLVGNEFEGWAWGGNPTDAVSKGVLGWISFNDKDFDGAPGQIDYQVMTSFSLPPKVIIPLQVDSMPNPYVEYCKTPLLSAIFSWIFDDPGDSQSAYQVQIDDDSNLDENPLIDSGKVNLSSNSYTPSSLLSADTPYWWRVKAWDSQGLDSEWATSTFTTKKRHPDPDFSFSPAAPSLKQVIQFIDNTKFYYASSSWSWDFKDGATSNLQSPTHTYEKSGKYQVKLTACDTNNNCCSIDKEVRVSISLPEWREIAPFSFSTKQFLAGFIQTIQKFKYWI